MTISRKERAERCYESARMEIDHIRMLQNGLDEMGKTLSPYLKKQAVMMARFYVRKGRAFQYTTERVNIRADLKPW